MPGDSGSYYKISLEDLRNEGIPDGILEALQSLKGKEFATKNELLSAVQKQIGKARTLLYEEQILKHITEVRWVTLEHRLEHRAVLPDIDVEVSSLQRVAPVNLERMELSAIPLGNFCPACGAPENRDTIVDQIMTLLERTGKFSVGGIKEFWGLFEKDLCALCQSKLNSIETNKKQALEYLKEAVKLDRSNQSAKENLTALKKML